MANRFSQLLLSGTPLGRIRYTFFIAAISLASYGSASKANTYADGFEIKSEVFDIGITTGMINIEDFPSEIIVGGNLTFKASEDFFLQYNYVSTTVSKSSFEKNPAFTTLNLGSDREYTHYDLLLGYNLFQAEFFTFNNRANLANLYVVGGIGGTNFGGEENFSYTVGVGNQIELLDRYIVRLDYRNYIYQSSLVSGGNSDVSHNAQLSIGLSYLF